MTEDKNDLHTKFPLNNGAITVETFDEENFNICIGEKCERVSKKELYSLLFFFGDEQQQEDLVPVRSTEMMMISRLLSITAQKDIKRGETIRVWYEYPISTAVGTGLVIRNPDRYRLGSKSVDDKLLKDVNRIV